MDSVSLRVMQAAAGFGGTAAAFGYSVLGFKINGVAMNGADIVVVGESALGPGRIAASQDTGASWYSFTDLAAATTAFEDVCYGDGKWVAVGVNTIAVSADLQTWTTTAFESKTFKDVIYAFGKFIAVGFDSGSSNGVIYTSTDAVTWTQRADIAASGFAGVAASPTKVITSGAANYQSTDGGITWSSVATGVSSQTGIGYGNGVFVICSTTSKYSLDDGVTWTATTGLAGFAEDVVWDGTYFLAVGQLITVTAYRSLDGITWSRSGVGVFSAMPGITSTVAVATSGGASVIIGNQAGILYSTNSLSTGTNISVEPYPGILSNTSPSDAGVGALYWDGTNYTAISAYGYQFTSPTGRDWTLSTPNFVSSFNYLGYATGLTRLTGGSFTYCALGVDTGFSSAAVATSSDGLTWTSRTLGATTPMYGLAASSSIFVAVGGSSTGVVRTSPDGITWTARTSNATNILRDVACKGPGFSTFVAVGVSGVIIYSSGGTTWSAVTSGVATRLNAVTFGKDPDNNDVWVAVGENGTVLTSPNGITWTDRSIVTTDDFSCVSWNGAVFVASGPNGTYTSANAVSWRKIFPYGGNVIASAGEYQTVIADQQGSVLMSPRPPASQYPS